MVRTLRTVGRYWRAYLALAVLFGLYLTSLPSYLLFHTLSELVAIGVATCTFIIAWTGRRLYTNSYLLVVGAGFGSLAVLEVLHTLVYKGMGALPHPLVTYSTQFWIASRGLLAVTLFLAPLLMGRRLRPTRVLLSYTAATGLLIWSIFVWHLFPVTFVDRPGYGVTPFKTIAEYVICALLAAGLLLLWRRRAQFDTEVLRYLGAAMLLTIASELFFSRYANLFGLANVLGHLLMVASFYCFYVAIVQTAFTQPLHLLFRDRERLLEAERIRAELAESLNREISHRVKNNLAMIAGLLQTQMIQQQDARVSVALSDAASRLMAFAGLHEELQAGPGDSVDMLGILQRIALASRDAFHAGQVATSVAGDPLFLPPKAAANLAVVANELITNALKHGAPGADGQLTVEVALAQHGEALHLRVRNSGAPVPPGFDPRNQRGLGLRLVHGLVTEQYQGDFRVFPEPGGCLAEVIAPLSSLRQL